MAKKTFKTVKQVQFFKDKSCTIKNGDIKHDLRVFPQYKAQVINSLGGVFGMAYKSNKNRLSKVVSCVTCANDPCNEYYYQLMVEGVMAYFKLNINLYMFDELADEVEYESVIPQKKQPKKADKFSVMKEVQEQQAMDNQSPLDSGIHESY